MSWKSFHWKFCLKKIYDILQLDDWRSFKLTKQSLTSAYLFREIFPIIGLMLAMCLRRLTENVWYNRLPSSTNFLDNHSESSDAWKKITIQSDLTRNKIETPENDGFLTGEDKPTETPLKSLETWNVLSCFRHGVELNDHRFGRSSKRFLCLPHVASPSLCRILKLLTICNRTSIALMKLKIWIHLDVQTNYLILLDLSRNLTTWRQGTRRGW